MSSRVEVARGHLDRTCHPISEIMAMATQRFSILRRQFFVKQGFQARFAMLPLGFLAMVLAVAGCYLYACLGDLLDHQLAATHGHVQNPWHLFTPELIRVAAWGGGVFFAVLCGWVCVRFAALHRDLDRLADWIAAHAHAHGRSRLHVPALRDREVRVLGESFANALEVLGTWEERVQEQAGTVDAAVAELAMGNGRERAGLARRVGRLCEALDELHEVLDEVKLDEEVS